VIRPYGGLLSDFSPGFMLLSRPYVPWDEEIVTLLTPKGGDPETR